MGNVPAPPQPNWWERAKSVATQGVPIGEFVEKQATKGPDDPHAVVLNTIQDLGLLSARTIQNLTSPANLAILGAMALGQEEAIIPKLANLGFSAEMATQATRDVSKGFEEAKKGNLREAGRLLGGAAVNALLIGLSNRKAPKGATYRIAGSEEATPRLAGAVEVPKPPTSEPPLPTIQDAELPKVLARGIVPAPTEPVPSPPDTIVHPRTIRSGGQAVTVTPDDIRAYTAAKLGTSESKHVVGTDGEREDLTDSQSSEAQRVREQKLPKSLHDELFMGSKYRAGMTVGDAVDKEASKPVPPPPERNVAPTQIPPPVPKPSVRPAAEPGWTMGAESYPEHLAQISQNIKARRGHDVKMVPDPGNPGKFWVQHRPQPPAPKPVPASVVPPPPPTPENAILGRLKDLHRQEIAIMSGEMTPERQKYFERLDNERESLIAKYRMVPEPARKPVERLPPIEVAPKSPAQQEAATAPPPEPPPEPTVEDKAKLAVARSGGEFMGVEEHPDGKAHVLFSDPMTKSTIALPVEEASKEAIERRLADSRAKYDAARNTDQPLEVGEPKKFIFERAGTLYAGKKKIPVEYGYMERSDVVGSHDANTFAPNPAHPGQNRQSYEHDPEQQASLEKMFMQPEPERYLSDSISPLEGPSMVLRDGSAAGGNKRKMWLDKMYGSKEPYAPIGGISRAKMLRDETIKAAQRHDIEGVEGMKEPVRVRRIPAPDTQGEWMDLTAMLNASPSVEPKAGEKAMFYAGRITPSVMSAIAGALEDLNPDASIREFMAAYPVDFVKWLQDSGAIEDSERLALLDNETGGLNDKGKELFENALLGKVLADGRLLDTAPQAVIGKLSSSLGPILRIGVRGGEWDIRPLLMQAAEVAGEAARMGVPVKDLVDQQSLLTGRPSVPKVVAAMAEFLDRKTPYVKKGIRQFAAEAAMGGGKQQATFLAAEPEPHDSFNAAFTQPLEEPPPVSKKGETKETERDRAKRLHRNEQSKRRATRYQISKEEYREALDDAHQARNRSHEESIRPED